MPKRGENIYKRKDGRYEGRYIKGRREDGKVRFGYIYAYSYAEAKTALTMAKALWHGSAKTLVIGKGTLAEFLRYWLENTVQGRVKPSTLAQYHERANNYILPALGHLHLRKLTPEQVRAFADGLINKNLAPSTVSGILGVLRSVMRTAQEMGACMSDPCQKIRLPVCSSKKAIALDRRQQVRLEQTAQTAEQGTGLAVFLSLYAGLRIGELCALRWRDIDLVSGTITVRGTLQRIKNFDGSGTKTRLIETAPKSQTSYRTIPLQTEIAQLLRVRGANASQDGYVLSGSERMIEPRILRARFATIARRAGLEINFHTLRHTFATRCLEFNFDVQTLAELLGHSNAGVTMRVYAHSMLDHKRQLVERMQILS